MAFFSFLSGGIPAKPAQDPRMNNMELKEPLQSSEATQARLSTEAVNISHFNTEASHYDEQFGLSVEQARARVRHILQHTQRQISFGQVLDMGCGTGNLTAALVLEGAGDSCVGLDISPGMVQVAQEKTRGMKGCAFRVGSATELPFPDASFDLCVGDAFLHHILDIEACLREVFRVLKPGGIASFNEPNAHGYAFLEFILDTVQLVGGWQDEGINAYLHALKFMREHQGDLAALAAYPLPDKHVFSPERIEAAGLATGFSATSWVPAMGQTPTLWRDAIGYVLDAIKAAPPAKAAALHAAKAVDLTLGDESRQHFCLHNQFYLYK
jgi:ubiquinone/menaquinone biosynthesis C-methylase UbiE